MEKFKNKKPIVLGSLAVFTTLLLSGCGGEKVSNDNTDVANQPKTSVIEKVVNHKKAEREIFDGSGDCIEEVLGPVADTVIGNEISDEEDTFLIRREISIEKCINKKISKGETLQSEISLTKRERGLVLDNDEKAVVRSYFP